MVHAKYVARIGITTIALIFGWALLSSPGIAVADTTPNSGATGSHAPRTGKAAAKPATARKAPATVARSTRAQASPARPLPSARSTTASAAPTLNSIVSTVTACACNLVRTVATYAALFAQELRPPTLPQPAPDPFGAWMVLAWVRKQADDAIEQIAALPVVDRKSVV